VEEDQLDVEGAAVFACLLYLTGHPESAQFWWQLAAGAGHRAAAYCLHLHHLALGEMREAKHWRHQVTDSVIDADALDENFLTMLEVFARYVRQNGSTASPPTRGGSRWKSTGSRSTARTSASSSAGPTAAWPTASTTSPAADTPSPSKGAPAPTSVPRPPVGRAPRTTPPEDKDI
jgi:hypothetical protein